MDFNLTSKQRAANQDWLINRLIGIVTMARRLRPSATKLSHSAALSTEGSKHGRSETMWRDDASEVQQPRQSVALSTPGRA